MRLGDEAAIVRSDAPGTHGIPLGLDVKHHQPTRGQY